jgi:DNA helicase-4
MKILIKPSWLSTIFSPGCASYSCEFLDYEILYSSFGDKKTKGYGDVASLVQTKGLFWRQLEIKLSDGGVLYLRGIGESQMNQISRIIKERKQVLADIKIELDKHADLLIRESQWCLQAIAGDYWIAQSDLMQHKSALLPLIKLYDAPLRQLGYSNILISQLEKIREFLVDPDSFKERNNKIFVKLECHRYQHFLDAIEKNSLTQEQREAVVTNEDSTLVIASAGSGKTSLLVGKVGYLLEKQIADPGEILVLAFNRNAKEEITERIRTRLGVAPEVHTFHSFGLKVIAEAHERKPSLAPFVEEQHQYLQHINQIVVDVIKDPGLTDVIANHFIGHFRPYKDVFDFKDLGEYYEFIKTNKPITLKGELVKSLEELELANYLFINGVKYIYEAQYEFDTATTLKRQYKPDFYLPDYAIYIEHFALDKHNHTPSFIDEEEYLASVDWKRLIHTQNNTTLIETYSYEKRDGALTANLRQKLASNGVKFKPLDSDQLFESLNQCGYVSEFAKICGTFLNLYKGRGISIEEFKDSLNESVNHFERIISFLSIFESIFEVYQNQLQSSRVIDFHDMILEASKLVDNSQFNCGYKFLLVDEFQDISVGRSKLLQSIQKANPGLKFLAVGDDWQSIYRFAGSDIGLMTSFENYFGFTKHLLLSETFRFNNRIESVASKFIQINPAQIKKSIVTLKASNQAEVILFLPNKQTGKFLEAIVGEIGYRVKGERASVLLLGRYNYTGNGIEFGNLAKIAPNCTFEFSTVHRAKGREADFVIVLDLSRGSYGFPSEIVDDPIVTSILASGESFLHSEERRLLYVALTRAKESVYLIGDPSNPSPFFTELVGGQFDIKKVNVGKEYKRLCAACKSGRMLEREGANGLFFGCEFYPLCAHTANVCKACGIGYLNKSNGSYSCDNELCQYSVKCCPSCKDGMLIEKSGKFGLFYGCSNYFSEGCNFTSPISH